MALTTEFQFQILRPWVSGEILNYSPYVLSSSSSSFARWSARFLCKLQHSSDRMDCEHLILVKPSRWNAVIYRLPRGCHVVAAWLPRGCRVVATWSLNGGEIPLTNGRRNWNWNSERKGYSLCTWETCFTHVVQPSLRVPQTSCLPDGRVRCAVDVQNPPLLNKNCVCLDG